MDVKDIKAAFSKGMNHHYEVRGVNKDGTVQQADVLTNKKAPKHAVVTASTYSGISIKELASVETKEQPLEDFLRDKIQAADKLKETNSMSMF